MALPRFFQATALVLASWPSSPNASFGTAEAFTCGGRRKWQRPSQHQTLFDTTSVVAFASRRSRQRVTLFSASASDKDGVEDSENEDGDQQNPYLGDLDGFGTPPVPSSDEKSQMSGYILEYLKKNAQAEDQKSETKQSESLVTKRDESSSDKPPPAAESTTASHLIALPMDNCHELLLELESVQRAILYHCPILAHACIPQATTRLPLLYVTVTDEPSAVTEERLFDLVNQAVQETLLLPSSSDDDDESDGPRPFLLQFQHLELDGSRNEVLQTAAVASENALKLRTMVELLRQRIQDQTKWTTALPPDPQQTDDDDALFRPRIPFMRLPGNWQQIIADEASANKNDEAYDDDDEPLILTSDEGGNGISPIFWYKWSEDDFGSARMREVAIYKRSDAAAADDSSEQTFHLPSRSVALPMGDKAMTKQEAKFRDYQEKRMLEQLEEFLGGDDDPDTASSEKDASAPPDEEDDVLLAKTRSRLESLYDASPSSADTSLTESDVVENEVKTEETPTASAPDDDDEKEVVLDAPPRPDRPEDPSAMDDWTRHRIQQAIASRAKAQSEQELARRRAEDKPPIAENEVFAKYKAGTLVPQNDNDKASEAVPALPPFPSREHCTGFWRVVASPTGFMVEEGDATRSDNLILRVDGTTAGGPILDQETRQKASGGTWRFVPPDTADAAGGLLIRLVIPPKKERILVMEGILEQAAFGQLPFTLAGSSFGIPEVEERKRQSEEAMEQDLISCTGNVWIEDAITKANRQEIGTFSLMKMNLSTHNPDSYTITVPRPIRNQD